MSASTPTPTPPEFELRWCPVCGRTDRWGHPPHSVRQAKKAPECPGTPVVLLYRPSEVPS